MLAREPPDPKGTDDDRSWRNLAHALTRARLENDGRKLRSALETRSQGTAVPDPAYLSHGARVESLWNTQIAMAVLFRLAEVPKSA